MFAERFLTRTKFKSYDDYKANCRIIVPDDFNFAYDVIDELAKENPELAALHWVNDKGEKKILSFYDISILSKKAANFFKNAGIKKGDGVMLILKSRHEFWVSMIALCRIGALAIPATHLLTSYDVQYRVREANIKSIIAFDDEFITSSIDNAKSGVSIKILVSPNKDNILDGWIKYDIEKCSDDFPAPRGADKVLTTDCMLGYFTSGTTSYPKLAIHDNTYPLGHIHTAVYWHNLEKGDLHFTVADTGWAKCSWGKLYGQWIAESSVFVYDYEDKFCPKDMLALIEEQKITSFCAPPTIYRFMLGEDFSKYDLRSLKKCRSAGEPLNPEVFNKFKNLTSLEIKEGFGQSETTVMLACYPWDEPKIGSMGKPVAGWNIQVVNENAAMCDPGEIGEIVVRVAGEARPSGLFREYHSKEATAKVMRGGLYYTGDMAYYDEEGFFWFVGRNDDVIKSSGYRISPFEVESAIIEHPAVVECAVTGVPDEVRGQSIKATIILNPDYKPGDDNLKKEIQSFVKKITAPYKYPRIVEFVDDLPKTISGKIKRKDIRDKNNI